MALIRRRLTVGLVSCVAALGVVDDAHAQAYGPRPGALRISVSIVVPGVSISIGGDGFAPKALVRIVLNSNQATLGTAETDSAGRLTASVRIPTSVAPGTHTVSARGRGRDGGTRVLAASVVVRASGQTTARDDGPRGGLPGTTGSDLAQATGGGTARRTGSSLPATGAPVSLLVLVAVVLVLAGAGAAGFARHRRFRRS